MTVNDRLRATAEAVGASMGEVRPLVLPPDPALLRPDRSWLRPDQSRLWPDRSRLRPDPSPLPPDPHPRPTRPARPGPPRSLAPPRPRGFGSWLVPLAAAVAVIAVAVTLVSVRDAARHRPAPPAPAPVAPSVAAPGYYAAIKLGPDRDPGLDGLFGVNSVVVGDARTGKQLAVINAPAGGTFDGVTGAADDRTFVLSIRWLPNPAGGQQATYAWDLLRLAPGAVHPVRLTRLPITDRLEDAVIHGLALSPDGRTLAVMFMPHMTEGNAQGPITLRTYTLATGKPLRTWTGAKPDGLVCFICENSVELSWLTGHTLAFSYPEAVLPQAIRTLEVSKPGDSLDADSRAVFPITNANVSNCAYPLLSASGRTVLCGATGGTAAGFGCATFGAPFDAYSTATGKLERVLYRYRGSCAYAGSTFLWAADSGTVAIGLVQAYTPGRSVPTHVIINGTSEATGNAPTWNDTMTFGLISRGKFTRLRLPTLGEFQEGVFDPALIAF